MTQIHQITILIPLVVGVSVVVCTVLVHALALNAAVKFVRREKQLGDAKLPRHDRPEALHQPMNDHER